jgi:hypothetical protein
MKSEISMSTAFWRGLGEKITAVPKYFLTSNFPEQNLKAFNEASIPFRDGHLLIVLEALLTFILASQEFYSLVTD